MVLSAKSSAERSSAVTEYRLLGYELGKRTTSMLHALTLCCSGRLLSIRASYPRRRVCARRFSNSGFTCVRHHLEHSLLPCSFFLTARLTVFTSSLDLVDSLNTPLLPPLAFDAHLPIPAPRSSSYGGCYSTNSCLALFYLLDAHLVAVRSPPHHIQRVFQEIKHLSLSRTQP